MVLQEVKIIFSFLKFRVKDYRKTIKLHSIFLVNEQMLNIKEDKSLELQRYRRLFISNFDS